MTVCFTSLLQSHLSPRRTLEAAPHQVQVFGKAEFLNPGGSVKDRVALEIIRGAVASGRLQRGGLVTVR